MIVMSEKTVVIYGGLRYLSFMWFILAALHSLHSKLSISEIELIGIMPLYVKAEVFLKFSDMQNINGENFCILVVSYYSTGFCTGWKSLYLT